MRLIYFFLVLFLSDWYINFRFFNVNPNDSGYNYVMQSQPQSIIIEVAEQFIQFLEPAIARISLRYQHVDFKITKKTVLITFHGTLNEKAIKKDLIESLYREKIYAETLSMRQIFLKSVMS